MNREEGYALRGTIEKLEQYVQCLKADHIVDKDEAFDFIRGKFAEEMNMDRVQVDNMGMLATVINAYRNAIDDYLKNKN